MTYNRTIIDQEDVKKLVGVLRRCPAVARFNEEPDSSAASLAYCFDSLEDYFREFLEKQLPQLAEGKLSDQEVCDALHEIGTTFGQILWHIKLPKFYGYIEENTPPATDAPRTRGKHG